MVVAKADSVERAARLFHALSDETRLQIIQELREGEQCVCDLVDRLGIAQSRLSFHLKTLKDAGLITDRPAGRWVYYALDSAVFSEAEELLRGFKPAKSRLPVADRCCQ
jgi:ArsR family transcriptional regulator